MAKSRFTLNKPWLAAALFFAAIAVGSTVYFVDILKFNSRAGKSDFEALDHKVKDLLLQHKSEDAIRMCASAVTLNPKDADAWELWGYVLEYTRSYNQAVEKYKKALELDPNHHRALDGISSEYLHLGKWNEALRYAKKFAELVPANPKGYVTTAEVLVHLDSLPQALSYLEQAENVDSLYWMTYLIRGLCLYDLWKLSEAAANFERASQLTQMTPECLTWWGRTLDAQRKHEEATQKYEEALAIDSNYSAAHAALAYTYLSQEKYENALKESEKFIRSHPHNSSGLVLKAAVFYYLKKYEESLSCLKDAQKIDSLYWEVYFQRGRNLYRLGKSQEAKANFAKAIQIAESEHKPSLKWGTKLYCYYKWALMLADIGDSAQARTFYMNAVSAFDTAKTYLADYNRISWASTLDSMRTNLGITVSKTH